MGVENMIFTQEMLESMKKVEAAREANIALEPRRLTAAEKDALLAEYHPDYREDAFGTITVGPNKGEKAPKELIEMLQAHSRISGKDIDLTKVNYEADVLVIGGGGSGSAAAIEAP